MITLGVLFASWLTRVCAFPRQNMLCRKPVICSITNDSIVECETLPFSQSLGGVWLFESNCKLRHKIKTEMHTNHLSQLGAIKNLGWSKRLSSIICISWWPWQVCWIIFPGVKAWNLYTSGRDRRLLQRLHWIQIKYLEVKWSPYRLKLNIWVTV